MTLHLNIRALHRTLLRHRTKVLTGIAVWTFLFVTGIMYFRMNRSASDTSLQSLADRMQSQRNSDHREEEEPIRAYCNAPHLIRARSEVLPQALMSQHQLSLVSVVLLVRHGDRGPLRPVRNFHAIHNNPFKMPEAALEQFVRQKELLSLFHEFNRSKESLSATHKPLPFDLVPSAQARLGHLTVLGALQHLKLGLEMGKVYAEHLNPMKRLESVGESLTAHSTHYERTFQSATAFLFGFLNHTTGTTPSLVSRLIADKLETSQGSFICSYTEYCSDCDKMKDLNKEWDFVREQELKSHPAIVDLLSKLSRCLTPGQTESNYSIGASRDAKSAGDLTHPNAAMDGLMAYLCHGSPLPCSTDTVCATIDDTKRVIAFLTSCFQKLVVNEAFLQNSLLKVRGLFQRLINHLNQVQSGKTFSVISLLSAHDITLVPVAAVLGLWDATIPPYASRISFEVYRQQVPGSNPHFFRIIYNGKDVTRVTEICRSFTKCASFGPVSMQPGISDTKDSSSSGSSSKTSSSSRATFTLIPMDQLQAFISHKFVQLTKTHTYAEACVTA